MKNKPEYIEFEVLDESKYSDMESVYYQISLAKNNSNPKPDKYWLEIFPSYSIKHFYFFDGDEKPDFKTSERTNNVWRFKAMINLLQTDMDVELLSCARNGTKGRIEFSACGYPYGGITGLTMFLNSFDCKSTEIDEGGGIYAVNWNSENSFELKEKLYPKTKGNKSNLWLNIKKYFLN